MESSMDRYTFFVEITKALAWPVSLLIIVFVFRKAIVQLMSILRNVKISVFELIFSKEMQEMQNQIPEEISKGIKKIESGKQSSDSTRLTEILDISPRVAVIEAWRIVETVALESIQKIGESNISVRTTRDLFSIASENHIWNDNIISFMQKLYSIRNHASHRGEDFVIPKDDARRYAHNALSLASYLKSTTSIKVNS